MKKNNPRWYALTKTLKAADRPYKISTGLTIPFIFGAYKLLGHPFENIDSLIKTILNSEIDKYPVIQRCHVIGRHVVAVEDKSDYNKNLNKYVNFESDNKNSRLIISPNTQLGKTLKRVCYSLAAEYLDAIKKEEYSWDNQKRGWRRFDEKEIELIRSVG